MLSLPFLLSSSGLIVGPPVAPKAGRAPTVRLDGAAQPTGLPIDLTGKVAFVAGVADSAGYGWAIVKHLAEAGATVAVGTWPPVLKIFEKSLKSGKLDDDLILSNGQKMPVPKIFPLDATFDTPDDVPEDVRTNKRYAGTDKYTVQEVADAVEAEYGRCDILIHSLANAPEVKAPLMQVSRKGYLAAASASSYSMVSMVQRFAPIMPKGGSVLALSFLAAERFVPGYGGGMSSAKAQLESDMRVLAFEVGRQYGLRINTISAGALKSRAASAIGGAKGEKTFIEYYIDHSLANAPLPEPLEADDVGATAAFLCSPFAKAITGVNMYVDNGMSTMASSVDSRAFEGYKWGYNFPMPGTPFEEAPEVEEKPSVAAAPEPALASAKA